MVVYEYLLITASRGGDKAQLVRPAGLKVIFGVVSVVDAQHGVVLNAVVGVEWRLAFDQVFIYGKEPEQCHVNGQELAESLGERAVGLSRC